VKTTGSGSDVAATVLELHSYDVPAITVRRDRPGLEVVPRLDRRRDLIPTNANDASDRVRHSRPMRADEIIERLGLDHIPKAGTTPRPGAVPPERTVGRSATAIHFLLRAGERSHWHRVDADEIWLHHAGAPLVLSIADDADRSPVDHVLGSDLAAGERPQVRVPAHAWQAAATTGEWTLVSCIVAPGFEFDGFELADPDWSPSADSAGTD
jgi:uncharacterized protein